MGSSGVPSGAEVADAWFEHSPFRRHLGLQMVSLTPDEAEVRLPFSAELATAGDVVHGGAISSLMDTAAALAAWSGHDPAHGGSWGTVGMALTFQSPAVGENLIAKAQVTRRGRALSFVEVTSRSEDGRTIAQALVTYRLG